MSSREIFFHGSCFDGAVSCLIASDYLGSGLKPRNLSFRPVNYEVRAGWLSDHLSEGAVVVDFLFHPDAEFWADHHPTTFLSREAERMFLGARRPDWLYEPDARSCAGLMYRWLAKERGHRNPHFEDVVGWAERIDSADYDSVEAAVFPTHPAPAVSQSFAVRPEPEYSVRIVRLLERFSGNVVAVASDSVVREAIEEASRRTKIGVERLKVAAEQDSDDIIVFDVDENDALISRYAPYVVAPSARYSVGIVRRGGEAKITTMRNPWRSFPSVDLGELCKRFGGGGHQRVGSILLHGPEVRRGAEIVRALVKSIHDASQ
jgi:hypothetical protein